MYSSHRISSETCQKLIFLLTGPRFNPALSVVFFAAVILCAASSEMRATYLFPSFPFPVKLDTFHWGPPGFHDEDTKIPKKWGWNESPKKKNDSAKSWHPQDFLLKVPLVVVSFCWLRNSSMSGIMSPNAFGPCQHFWWNLVVEPRFKNKKPKSMENNKSLKPTSLYISSFVGYSTSYNIIPQISPSDCWLAHVSPPSFG